jgi:hypothetical protein
VGPAKETADYPSVHTWRQGLTEQWGEEPANFADRVATLHSFCAFVESDPDAMIEECTREVESGKRIRIKARRKYSEKIAEFQAAAPGDGRAQARAANTVRSFFIHNGIFMQAGLSD